MSRGRNRGRRYDVEPKLNMKKVFAVIVAFVVIIMFILVIKGAFNGGDETSTSTISKRYFSAEDAQSSAEGISTRLTKGVHPP